MKALKIYETLSFERKKDPKESMGIGSEEFRMVNEIDKELKPMGFIKTGPADMGSQSDYMRSLEEWKKSNNEKTKINFYFINWYGIEWYKFSIGINGYPYYGGRETTWQDFKNRWDSWTNAMEIVKVVDLKSGSILKAKEKCVISSKRHEFRFVKDQRKMDYVVEENEQIQITDIDFNERTKWGGIKTSYNNTYFICNAVELWDRFEIIKL
jgi:hypothetical protein